MTAAKISIVLIGAGQTMINVMMATKEILAMATISVRRGTIALIIQKVMIDVMTEARGIPVTRVANAKEGWCVTEGQIFAIGLRKKGILVKEMRSVKRDQTVLRATTDATMEAKETPA